ncbi:sulfotransferase domain-containing protein [Candidatus Pelagibacter bacterium nBUS_30]|uniref:sulfotransferase domain-containing protein n=1 Tax=Candidatus Pelagibacter bacterium nBUS_30 TaxID=3374191 RepID=UPI003EBFE34E
MKHNFFIICGGYACGTTFLSESLKQHPQIRLIKKEDGREYNFFVNDFLYQKKGIEWYKKFFKKNNNKIIIEHSSQLFSSKKGLNRLYKFDKKVKLIIVLRDRISRTWADYRYSVLNGWEKLSFYKAITTERERNKKLNKVLKRIKPFSYLDRSNYTKYLKHIFKKFNNTNILIINSEDLNKNPDINFKKIFNFLNVKNIKLKKVPSFSSFYVKDKLKQSLLRKQFKNNLNPIIEKIRSRKKIETKNFSSLQKKKLLELKRNIQYKVPKIPINSEKYLTKYYLKTKTKLKNLTSFDL